jgi:hypothetical protein
MLFATPGRRGRARRAARRACSCAREAVGDAEDAHARARVGQAARDLEHGRAEAAGALVLLERDHVAVPAQVHAEQLLVEGFAKRASTTPMRTPRASSSSAASRAWRTSAP